MKYYVKVYFDENRYVYFCCMIAQHKYIPTAPEDPPMEFSTTLARDKARSAGTCTGRPGLSFEPRISKIPTRNSCNTFF